MSWERTCFEPNNYLTSNIEQVLKPDFKSGTWPYSIAYLEGDGRFALMLREIHSKSYWGAIFFWCADLVNKEAGILEIDSFTRGVRQVYDEKRHLGVGPFIDNSKLRFVHHAERAIVSPEGFVFPENAFESGILIKIEKELSNAEKLEGPTYTPSLISSLYAQVDPQFADEEVIAIYLTEVPIITGNPKVSHRDRQPVSDIAVVTSRRVRRFNNLQRGQKLLGREIYLWEPKQPRGSLDRDFIPS